jgi:hypothetical protein
MQALQTEQRTGTKAAVWAVPLLLAAAVICFFWKLVLTDQYTWLENHDAADQILPWFQYQAREWHEGRFPLWDPYQWGGQSLIGQMQPGVAYPPNWLLFLLPLENGYIRQSFLHWYWVLIHVQAALFCYLLCRDLGRSRGASFLAGLAFSLAGYVGTTGWPQMLNGVAWAPLIFLFQLRALRGERPVVSAGLSGMFLGIAWLSGHHQAPTFLALGVAALWADALVRRRGARKGLLRASAAFVALLVLTSALQVLPAYEYGRLAVRWVGAEQPVGWADPVPYAIHREYSLSPASLPGIILPGIHRLNDPYFGVVCFTLALLGLAAGWADAAARRMAFLALLGLLLALGGFSVFHGVAYALVPGVEKARTPLAATCLFSLGLAVLVAWGVDGFERLRGTDWPRRTVLGLCIAGGALFALEAARMLVVDPNAESKVRLAALSAVLLAALFAAWSRGSAGRPAATVCLALLAMLEIGSFIGVYLPNRYVEAENRYLPKMRQNADIVGFLRRQPGPFRIEVDPKEVSFNFGDWHGLESTGGYVASLAANIYRQDWGSQRLRDMYGVRYSVAREARPGQQEVFHGESGLKILLNSGAFPRAWVVHRAERGSGVPDDPAGMALVAVAPPQLEECSEADSVEVLHHNPAALALRVRMGCRGLLVISEHFFPGWKAEVDGRAAEILQVNGALRGLVLDRGMRRVEMRYRPAPVLLGGLMTASGLLAGVLLWALDRRRVGPPRMKAALSAWRLRWAKRFRLPSLKAGGPNV